MGSFIDTSVWVPIHTLPGFESCIEYYINRKGQVKSTKGVVERILKHKKHKSGYPMVSLTQRLGKKGVKYCCVHTLVAFAFLGPPPTPYGKHAGCSVVDHKDENKKNCHVDNLRWVTRRENNTKHAYQRRPKNTPEEDKAYSERQKIAKRDYMRRKRAEAKSLKIEESDN